jgi:hypothetical protein
MKDAFIFETEPFGTHSEFVQSSPGRHSSFASPGNYSRQPLSPFAFESEIYQPADSEDVIQGFIGTEHRDVGDLALGQKLTSIVYDKSGKRLTFGEMIALAGDYFETYYQMAELARTSEGRAQIAWARWDALNLPKVQEPSDKFKKSVIERSYVLSSTNISHFSAGGTGWKTYSSWHSAALVDAFDAGEQSDDKIWQRAISKEGFACHFLTDIFSAGHVRTPRIAMRNWYGQHFPDSIDRFVKYMAKFIYDDLNKRNRLPARAKLFSGRTQGAIGKRIKALGGAAIRSFSLGDILSLAIHDFDNPGLDVVTEVDANGKAVKGGYRWKAVGDSHLKGTLGAQTKTMVVKAVKVSFGDLERARAAGKKAAGRKLTSPQRADAIKKAIGSPLFAAKAFVPKEDLSSKTNVRLPGTGSGNASWEWRWGKLGSVAYQEVDKTVKGDIVRRLKGRLPEINNVVKESGVTIVGIKDAFKSFINYLESATGGIRVLEAAVGKKAK